MTGRGNEPRDLAGAQRAAPWGLDSPLGTVGDIEKFQAGEGAG